MCDGRRSPGRQLGDTDVLRRGFDDTVEDRQGSAFTLTIAPGSLAGNKAVECSYPLDDPEYLEIAQLFVQRLATQLAAMRDACTRDDDGELAGLAHWLTGSGGTAGFGVFTQPAHELDVAARSRQRHRYRSLIQQLNDLAARIEVQVKT